MRMSWTRYYTAFVNVSLSQLYRVTYHDQLIQCKDGIYHKRGIIYKYLFQFNAII